MIADNRETTSEVVLRLVTAPLWVPIYLTYLGCRKAAQVMARSEAGEQKPVWLPATEIERAVYAALILAGEPVNNRRLASLMGCSPGEASKRVAQLEGAIRKSRKGREVLISLH